MGASFPEEGRVGLECAAEPPGSQRRLRRHFRTSRVRRSSPPRRIVGWAMHANLTQGWPRRRSPWRWRIATDAHGLVASINRPGPVPRDEARPAIFDTLPRSTTGPAGPRASAIARPTMKRSPLSPNPVSTFPGQHQSAASAGKAAPADLRPESHLALVENQDVVDRLAFRIRPDGGKRQCLPVLRYHPRSGLNHLAPFLQRGLGGTSIDALQ